MSALRSLLVLMILATPAASFAAKGAEGSLKLNGVSTPVLWTDGDSFRIKSGPYKGKGTRLVGFNALEAYGPVHRWGSWKATELYAIALSSAAVAAAKEWECTVSGDADGYNRLLVDCPELSLEMVGKGVAFVFAVEEKPSEKLLAAQAKAQAEKKGIWAKGVPSQIISSAHSAEEKKVYNRVVDSKTGAAVERPHNESYETCKEVCVGEGADASCIVYVPYESRYKRRPDCLRASKDEQPPEP